MTLAHLRENPECAKAARSFVGLYRASQRKAPPKAGPGRGHKKEKPTVAELTGSDPNFTGSLSTDEYIRSIRKGEPCEPAS